MPKAIAIWGIVAIASAIIAGIVAGAKRRDHSFWAAWSFLFPPMLLILLLMPSNKGPRPRRPGLDELEEQELEARVGALAARALQVRPLRVPAIAYMALPMPRMRLAMAPMT